MVSLFRNSEIMDALLLLRPYDMIDKQKRRFGRALDGGYVLLDDTVNFDSVYSFGISNEISFEKEMAELGKAVYMYDHTIDGIPENHPKFFFHRKGIAGTDRPDEQLFSLETLISENGNKNNSNMLLKLDVEGAEFEVFEKVDLQALSQFRQIAIEIHWLAKLWEQDFRKTFVNGMRRLLTNFSIVHVHANNNRQAVFIEGFPIADVLEITLVRSDIVSLRPSRTVYPTNLDFPNNPRQPDVLLWFFPFYPFLDQHEEPKYSDALQNANVFAKRQQAEDMRKTVAALKEARSESAKVSSVRPTAGEMVSNKSKKLKILYYGFHEVLAYDDISLLSRLGHTVFSPLVFRSLDQSRKLRSVPSSYIHAELAKQYEKTGLSREFVSQFDVAIYIHNPSENISRHIQALKHIPVVYRTIGQCTNASEAALKPFENQLTIVRYSDFETRGLNHCRTDAVIRFGKKIDFLSNRTESGRVTTFHSGFVRRTNQSTPNVEDYKSISSLGNFDLYGSANEGIPVYRGLVDDEKQLEIYNNSSLYLFVHTVPTSYTLNFIEALCSGVPVLAPTADYIVRNTHKYGVHVDFYAERYEIPDLLGNDERVLFYSVDDAKKKISRLMDDGDLRQAIRYNQTRVAISEFDEKSVGKDWDNLLRRII